MRAPRLAAPAARQPVADHFDAADGLRQPFANMAREGNVTGTGRRKLLQDAPDCHQLSVCSGDHHVRMGERMNCGGIAKLFKAEAVKLCNKSLHHRNDAAEHYRIERDLTVLQYVSNTCEADSGTIENGQRDLPRVLEFRKFALLLGPSVPRFPSQRLPSLAVGDPRGRERRGWYAMIPQLGAPLGHGRTLHRVALDGERAP